MDVDDALQLLGTCGLYQVMLYFMLAGFEIMKAWQAFAINFEGAEPEYHCKVPEATPLNESIPQIYDSCGTWQSWETCTQYVNISIDNTTQECQNGYSYANTYGNTILMEWDLVCDKKLAVPFTSTVFMFGKFVGSLIAPQLADILGRKPAMIWSNILFLAFGLIQAFTQTYTQFIIMNFLIATAQTGAYLATFVLLCESVPPSLRSFVGTCDEIMWSVGIMTLPLLAYLVQDWRILQIIISLPLAIVFSYFCLLPESVHWLASRNRLEEAEKVLQRGARINNVRIPENCLTRTDSQDNAESEGDPPKRSSLLDVYRTPGLRLYSTLMHFIWIIVALVYYGLSFGTSTLSGNFYLNAFLMGAVEVPAFLAALLLVDWVGRRKTTSFFLLLAGLPIFAIYFVKEYTNSNSCDAKDLEWLLTTLTMVGKSGITASFACIYLYTAELYPTVVRNIGVGLSSSIGRIGAMIAPLTIPLQDSIPALQPFLFGGLAMLAAVTVLFFPETRNRKLPETLSEWTRWNNGELDLHTENTAADSKNDDPRVEMTDQDFT